MIFFFFFVSAIKSYSTWKPKTEMGVRIVALLTFEGAVTRYWDSNVLWKTTGSQYVSLNGNNFI